MQSAAAPTDPARPRKVLTASGFAHFVHDGLTDTIFILLPLWAAGFGLSHSQVGLLKASLSAGVTVFQVPAGHLAERFGERIVLVLGTALAGLGYLALTGADGFTSLAVGLVVVGVGCSTQHPLASALVSKAFAQGRRRAAIGTYNFAGDLGKIATPAAVAGVAGVLGWQFGSVLCAVVGLAAAAALYAVLGRMRAGEPVQPEAGGSGAAQGGGWGVRDCQGFAILASISMIDSSVRYSVLTFLPFLLIGKGAETEAVGFALALVFAGGAAGKLICGLVAERLGILRTVVVTELATAALIGAVLIVGLDTALVLLPALGVALNGTSSVLYGTVGDFTDPDRQPRAFGLFYSLGTGAGVVAPFAFGLVGDTWGLTASFAAMAAAAGLILPLCLGLRRPLAAVRT